jgi:hypothetical protein
MQAFKHCLHELCLSITRAEAALQQLPCCCMQFDGSCSEQAWQALCKSCTVRLEA